MVCPELQSSAAAELQSGSRATWSRCCTASLTEATVKSKPDTAPTPPIRIISQSKYKLKAQCGPGNRQLSKHTLPWYPRLTQHLQPEEFFDIRTQNFPLIQRKTENKSAFQIHLEFRILNGNLAVCQNFNYTIFNDAAGSTLGSLPPERLIQVHIDLYEDACLLQWCL